MSASTNELLTDILKVQLPEAILAIKSDASIVELESTLFLLLDILCATTLNDSESDSFRVLEQCVNCYIHYNHFRIALEGDARIQNEKYDTAVESACMQIRSWQICSLSQHLQSLNDAHDFLNCNYVKHISNRALRELMQTATYLSKNAACHLSRISQLIGYAEQMVVQSVTSFDIVLFIENIGKNQGFLRGLLLKLLNNAMLSNNCPRATFLLQGPHTGIFVPLQPIAATRSKCGYTYSFGLQLSNIDKDAILFTLHDMDRHGVIASIVEDSLVIQSVFQHEIKQEYTVPFRKIKQELHRSWVHLSFVHAKKRLFKDQFIVYVDGKHFFTAHIAYLENLHVLGGLHCIGNSVQLDVSSLQGHIWSPILMSSPLDQLEIEKLHWNAWNHSNNLESIISTEQSNFVYRFDSRNCNRNSNIVYDTSGNSCHGFLHSDTYPMFTLSTIQAIDGIGGCICFLLLLLNCLPETYHFHAVSAMTCDETVRILQLIAIGLETSLTSRSLFVKLEGLSLLTFALRAMPSNYFVLDMLSAIVRILNVISKMESESLENCVYQLLTCTTWISAPVETLRHLLESIVPEFLHMLLKEQNRELSDPPQNRKLDVAFFCNFLSEMELKDCESKDLTERNVLRKVIVEQCISPFLFPKNRNGELKDWKQFIAHICRRSMSDTATSLTSDVALVDVEVMLSFLIHSLRSEAQKHILYANLLQISRKILRIFFCLLRCATSSLRHIALEWMEALTCEKRMIAVEDIVMLSYSLSAHALDQKSVEIVCDFIFGRKSEQKRAIHLMPHVYVPRIECVPRVLLSLCQPMQKKVQALVLHEIWVLMAQDTDISVLIKESIAAHPFWLSRLNALRNQSGQRLCVRSERDEIVCAAFFEEIEFVGSKLEAVEDISGRKDFVAFKCVLGLVEERSDRLPVALGKAIIDQVLNGPFDDESEAIVRIWSAQIIGLVLAHTLLHSPCGWLGFLELYFYFDETSDEFLSLTSAICKEVSFSIVKSELFPLALQNLCQMAAFLTFLQEKAKHCETHDRFSVAQRAMLCRETQTLYSIVLPKFAVIPWAQTQSLLREKAAQHETDVMYNAVHCRLVASRRGSMLFCLLNAIDYVELSAKALEPRILEQFQALLKQLRLIMPDTEAAKMATPSSAQDFFDDGIDHSPLMVHCHVLKVLIALLQLQIRVLSSNVLIILFHIIIRVAQSALLLHKQCDVNDDHLESFSKALEIISSTDLSFFIDLAHLYELWTLWSWQLEQALPFLHEMHTQMKRCVLEQVENLQSPWTAFLQHFGRTDFEIYAAERDLSFHAKILSDELFACEKLWTEWSKDAALACREEIDEKERRLAVEHAAERLANGIQMLSSSAQSRDCVEKCENANVRRGSNGFLYKIGSRETSLRMRLEIKKLHQDTYRLRALSCEFPGSICMREPSHGDNGRMHAKSLRLSMGSQMEHDPRRRWHSDAASDYNDILADTKIRAVLLQSWTGGRDPYDDASDEDMGKQLEVDVLEEPLPTEEDINRALSETTLALEGNEIRDSSLSNLQTPTSPLTSIAAQGGASQCTSPQGAYAAFGASVLNVVEGVAEKVQNAARNAKDAVDFQMDSLYAVRDNFSDEAHSIMNEVSTLLEHATSPRQTKPLEPEWGESGNCSSLNKGSETGSVSWKDGANAEHHVRVKACLVQHMYIVEGILALTSTALHFTASKVLDEHRSTIMDKEASAESREWRFLLKSRRWKLDEIESVYRRRYLLQATAIEIFVRSNRKNYFFTLSLSEIVPFYDAIMARRPVLLRKNPLMRRLRHPSSLFKNSSMTVRWVHHEISTFEYLMWLNTIAGRTYNDLSQYPVFPWVISDYTSSVLDLGNASTFRDLRKPIGALDNDRLLFFKDRYSAFEDPIIPKFLYGTHYSNIGAVLYYLIRLEPFTSYALSFQGGKLDHADRIFHSVSETWHNCLSDPTDVKELTPEWFYLPEFLSNGSNIDFGHRQNGDRVDHVLLPPWAKSAEDFVIKNYMALESSFVSQHLHHWIDLIFGYKQRGSAATAADNVFFYLTYEGMVDVDSIQDPVLQSSTRAQIAHFGQVPSQLLRDPHPSRHTTTNAIASPLLSSNVNKEDQDILTALANRQLSIVKLPHSSPIRYIQMNVETSSVVCIDDGGNVSSHRYCFKYRQKPHSQSIPSQSNPRDSQNTPFSDEHSAVEGPFIELYDRKCRKIISDSSRIIANIHCTNIRNSLAFMNRNRIICTVGYLDCSARFHSATDGALLHRLYQHHSIVQCVTTSLSGSILVLGCQDGTLSVWKTAEMGSSFLDSIKLFRGNAMRPVHAHNYAADQILLGHSSPIQSLSVSDDLQICLSGSASNVCLAHCIKTGKIMKEYAVKGTQTPGIISIALSETKHIVIQSLGTGRPILYIFHMNGNRMAMFVLEERMANVDICTRFSRVIVSNSKAAYTLSVHSLREKRKIADEGLAGSITSQRISFDQNCVSFGTSKGMLIVCRMDLVLN